MPFEPQSTSIAPNVGQPHLALPPLSTIPISPPTLKVLLDTFDHALSHTHYSVTGHAALVIWGYRSEMPSYVSLVCPAQAKQVILTWARAAGLYIYPTQPNGVETIGVPLLRSPTGMKQQAEEEVWPFKMRTVDAEAFELLERVKPFSMEPPYLGSVKEMLRTEAIVLTPPTLLNEFARAWYFHAVKGSDSGGVRGRNIAGKILYLMVRMAMDAENHGPRTRWKLTVQNVPILMYEKFWYAFTRRFPEALKLREKCGLLNTEAISRDTLGDVGAVRLDDGHYPEDYDYDSFMMRVERGEASPLQLPTS
ncbi:hypothetical protein VTI74DRAFT_5040 [Chaetomium olivicolor]